MFLPVVCLCGLQWLCLLSVGDLKVNVSKGRSVLLRTQEKIEKQYCMSLRTAMIVFVKCRRSESKCFCRSYVFADCNGCVLLRTQEKIEKQYCMSLRTAMIVFVKCRRSESKYVSKGRMSLRTAATETKRKSTRNIVCLCGLQ